MVCRTSSIKNENTDYGVLFHSKKRTYLLKNQAFRPKLNIKDFTVSTSIILTKIKLEVLELDAKTKESLQSYIGKESEYYINWLDHKGIKGYSWSWFIFLFAPLWLAYRKMWLFLSLYLSIHVITLAMTWGNEARITGISHIIFMLFFAIHGNNLYMSHVQNKIQQNKGKSNEELKKMGGTSFFATILTAIFILVMIGTMFVVRLYS